MSHRILNTRQIKHKRKAVSNCLCGRPDHDVRNLRDRARHCTALPAVWPHSLAGDLIASCSTAAVVEGSGVQHASPRPRPLWVLKVLRRRCVSAVESGSGWRGTSERSRCWLVPIRPVTPSRQRDCHFADTPFGHLYCNAY